LKLAAEKAGWGKPMPKRHGRGIACRTDGACSAQVAEVSVEEDGTVRVLRVVSAVDCGIAVNPDGAVEQSNFHDYQVLRIDSAPAVEVYIVPSTEDPMGVGELGAMLVGPAVANAVFHATGIRIRRLPIDAELLRAH
jgi:isoquinoline 1-oxidoreductase beta subunit